MYPGQNIRISHYTNYPQTNIKKELYNGILDWFKEYSDVASNIIDKYENRPGHKQYGHFTAMAKDNNDKIGKSKNVHQSKNLSKIFLDSF